jgi:small subunit ribosomal protein S3
VQITRNQKEEINVIIHTARPGAVLGQGGDNIKKLTLETQKATRDRKLKITLSVKEISKPDANAKLIAENIAIQLENRGSFRRAQKMVIRSALKSGAIGIKTQVSGRLNGADMARSEGYTKGIMSLHTLRQNVDYATATARTTYGAIGIKV